MIIDTHAHFVEAVHAGMTMSDMSDEPLPVEQLLRDMDEAGVDKLIQVTRSFLGYDNRYSLVGAVRFPDRIRVVGRFDASGEDMPERLRSWAGQPYMVGVRLMTMFPSEAPWWDDGTLERFWPEAERLNLPVLVYAPERSSMLGGIAERHPGLKLIVEHIGMRTWDIFKSPPSMSDYPNFLALERYPNIHVKISAIPETMTERYPFPKSQERIREIYDAFGPDRMMWGSNYPRTLQVCTYREAVDLVRSQCAFLNSDDRAKILGRTAASVFGLPWGTPGTPATVTAR